jgi:hypothetical protein
MTVIFCCSYNKFDNNIGLPFGAFAEREGVCGMKSPHIISPLLQEKRRAHKIRRRIIKGISQAEKKFSSFCGPQTITFIKIKIHRDDVFLHVFDPFEIKVKSDVDGFILFLKTEIYYFFFKELITQNCVIRIINQKLNDFDNLI